MRHLKFILFSLAILLAGALAAGLAAREVVSPRTGEAVSAGVVSIPSVLGQTAEEVLFYPWSLYESQTLSPSSPLLDDPDAEEALKQEAESYSKRFFTPFTLFGADFDAFDAYCAVQYAFISRSQLSLAFLKDFPGQAGDGTPLSLSFAASIPDGAAPSSISYLVRPRNPGTVTEEQQAQALDRVKADLRELLITLDLLSAAGSEIRPDTAYASGSFYVPFLEGGSSESAPSKEALPTGNDLAALLSGYCALARTCGVTCTPVILTWEYLQVVCEFSGFTGETTLDDALAALDKAGVQVQLVSTPDQIIVLFTNGNIMVGAYYDVQLERYSGIGLSS